MTQRTRSKWTTRIGATIAAVLAFLAIGSLIFDGDPDTNPTPAQIGDALNKGGKAFDAWTEDGTDEGGTDAAHDDKGGA